MREGVKRKASPQCSGSVNKVRRVGPHFFFNSKGQGGIKTALHIQECSIIWAQRYQAVTKERTQVPSTTKGGNLESEQGQLQKRKLSYPQKEGILPYSLCLSSRNRSFLPKSQVEAAGDPAHRSALPSFASGQVYSYHLPVNTKWWVEVLQDLHYTKSFLGTQRHV